ncbi:phosphatidyl inositol kinase (PIK-A), partial [Thraustotheca clavata]
MTADVSGAYSEYKYYLSSSVDVEVTFLLSYVDMPPHKVLADENEPQNELFPMQNLYQMLGTPSEIQNSMMNELFVTAQLFADGLPMHTMSISTKSPSKCTASSIYWNEWITLPVKYRDLPRNAVLTLTLWGIGEIPIGGTTFSIFARDGLLKDGTQCLRVWPGAIADPDVVSSTPSEYEFDLHDGTSNSQLDIVTRQMECFRLDKAKEKYDRHEMLRLEWIDRITNRRIARIRKSTECPAPKEEFPSYIHMREEPCLWIEMPYFGHPVVFEEEPYPIRNNLLYGEVSATRAPASLAADTPANNPRSINRIDNNQDSMLVAVWDPDLNEDNPAERKYRKLARDILRGSIDPNLKPNREEKFAIDRLLSSSSDHLKNDEKDLLWKFRYMLIDNRKAIVKFLLSVDWMDDTEVTLTAELLQAWCEIDVADALKLLGPRKEFRSDFVRNFAVSALDKAQNEELLDYLLQLVQALRYERRNENFGPLARFLISRSCKHFKMANFFYWYLQVEVSDLRDGEMYQKILDSMLAQMRETEDGIAIYNMLQTQNKYMNMIMAYHLKARDEKGKKDVKEEKLKLYLKQMQWQKGVHIRLPLDPSIHLSGLVPSSAKMFKSAMYPCVVDFQTVLVETDTSEDTEATSLRESLSILHSTSQSFSGAAPPLSSMTSGRFLNHRRDREGPLYKVMIKNGDDLRQDQLVMQMFSLMDRLLKKVNLDLKLVSYQILATSPTAGLMMFVNDSHAVSAVISNYKTIQAFLRTHNPDPMGYE